MTVEEWRPVVGYEEAYEVSSYGRVRRYGSVLSPGVDKSTGYVRASLVKDGVWKHVGVHILVVEAFSDQARLPEQTHINHLDGIKTNNVPGNLEYSTPSGNAKHAQEHGLTPPPPILYGEAHPRSKLTDYQVAEMRRLRGLGFTYKDIGFLFGVTGTQVSRVCRFETRSNGADMVPAAKKRKLTSENVAAIRAAYRPGVPGHSLSALAKEYGVGPSAIHKIVTGARWSEEGEPSL